MVHSDAPLSRKPAMILRRFITLRYTLLLLSAVVILLMWWSRDHNVVARIGSYAARAFSARLDVIAVMEPDIGGGPISLTSEEAPPGRFNVLIIPTGDILLSVNLVYPAFFLAITTAYLFGRATRKPKGCCRRCGYPLHTLPASPEKTRRCPECGAVNAAVQPPVKPDTKPQ